MDITELLIIKKLKLVRLIKEMYFNKEIIDFEKIIFENVEDKDDIKKVKKEADMILEECIKNHIDIVSFFDANYPDEFKCLKDAPILFYKKGILNSSKKVTIAGSRNPSSTAEKFCEEISKAVIDLEYVIVSGLALGIDTIAHKVSLKNKKPTIAILPSNLVDIYPKSNKILEEEILDCKGCLISEYSPLEKLKKYFFVKRDRLQAAYSNDIIVVETKENGGTMHTARYSKEYGKNLYCIKYSKGRDNEFMTSGNRKLLNDKYTIPITDISSFKELLMY
jgi:DNA processing protein